LKPKLPLRLGLDLTGADRPVQELAQAIPLLRGIFTHISLRVFWPHAVPISEELLSCPFEMIDPQELSNSRLHWNRVLSRLPWATDRQWGKPRSGVAGCELTRVRDVVGMQEEPLEGLRRAPASALPLMMRALRENLLDVGVSCGNTGAMVAAAHLGLPRLEGGRRLCLAAALPTAQSQRRSILVDCGATLEPSAEQLLRFCEWGSAWAQTALGHRPDSVGLLNIGVESHKGSAVLREVYGRLQQGQGLSLHQTFVGNLEPGQVWQGQADLVLSTGLMGNLYLKTLEALRPRQSGIAEADSCSMGGAAALLGVQGRIYKLHGSSGPQEIVQGVETVVLQVERELAQQETAHSALP